MSTTRSGLHPRNRHRHGYDFKMLIKAHPPLAPFVRPGPHGRLTIDFADPRAVKALNAAILFGMYRLRFWDIPDGYLCPPIPGRVDYLHHLADLLGEGTAPGGKRVRLLDIGTGANCIYPLLGHQEYGWSFVGSDVEPASLRSASLIVQSNALQRQIECRLQPDRRHIFQGLLRPDEHFAATLCNPPFHASAKEASSGSERKLRNLARARGERQPQGGREPSLNFGGQHNELWCDGGELAFLRRMIAESADYATQCDWFTTLVSKGDNLAPARKALAAVKAAEVRVIPMEQGNKVTRILAWRFSNTGSSRLPPGKM
ncbi:23S rRNA (adenine(1618)-N(6))-methyltransferase RlmF [Aeromonas sp. R6-2]|uniref:23S rRNA (adenine(1618)-N(6))-methyltransferase RlmF n=1 Tax=unclassified Aeromonas TaxID=257493 RepID=UPI0034A5B573